MATEKGPIATEAPLITGPLSSTTSLPAVAAPDSLPTEPPTRAKSLKRARESTPTSSAQASGGLAATELSPSKIARLVGFASRQSPAPLTGAAALEDERRRREEEQRLHPPGATSENPSQKVITDLRSGPSLAMSRPQDAPGASPAAGVENAVQALQASLAMSRTQDAATPVGSGVESAVKALQAVSIPGSGASNGARKADPNPDGTTSPISMDSAGTGRNVTHSPAPMDVDPREDQPYALQPEAQMEDKGATSLSYPGILPSAGSMAAPTAPQRAGSLPTASSPTDELTPRSPSSKKHKCPYCDTVFTRHHNLKSHLLTHSQEKPFVCASCQMRFRRLHDLKRHSKLHTGEKPHICPKCDRKFARGDALARHSKGAGGCANRRTSMGSFGGEDDYEGASTTDADDSAMTGILYAAAAGAELTEEERRRLSLPSIKAQHVAAGQAPAEGYGPHSHTYPPAGQRGGVVAGGLYPPNVDRGAGASVTSASLAGSAASGHTPTTSISSIPLSGGSSSLYSQSGMTESPKPLSPGAQGSQAALDAGLSRKRSGAGAQSAPRQSGSGLSRPVHGMPTTGAAATSASQQGAPVGNAASAAAVENSNNLFASGEMGFWAYVQTLEEQVKRLTDKIGSMENQIASMERKETAQEAQISYLSSELSGLRQQLEAKQEPPTSVP